MNKKDSKIFVKGFNAGINFTIKCSEHNLKRFKKDFGNIEKIFTKYLEEQK